MTNIVTLNPLMNEIWTKKKTEVELDQEQNREIKIEKLVTDIYARHQVKIKSKSRSRL